MNGEKKDFWILLWSGEDIRINNEDIRLIIQSDAPDAEIHVVNLENLRQMGVMGLKSFLDGYSAQLWNPKKQPQPPDYPPNPKIPKTKSNPKPLSADPSKHTQFRIYSTL